MCSLDWVTTNVSPSKYSSSLFELEFHKSSKSTFKHFIHKLEFLIIFPFLSLICFLDSRLRVYWKIAILFDELSQGLDVFVFCCWTDYKILLFITSNQKKWNRKFFILKKYVIHWCFHSLLLDLLLNWTALASFHDKMLELFRYILLK